MNAPSALSKGKKKKKKKKGVSSGPSNMPMIVSRLPAAEDNMEEVLPTEEKF